MLLQSLRLAWPIFSQGWPLFYFCHLWATQLLIHMQMKLTPALVCLSARCFSAQYAAFRGARLILSTAVAQLLERGEGKEEPHTWQRYAGKAENKYSDACLGNLSVWSLTALQTHAACRFAPPLQRFERRIGGGGGRGRKGERAASCRGRSPEWLRGGSLVTGNAKACDETCALSGVCCRRFTRASQVSP